LLTAVSELYGDQFAWLPPPYEYELNHLPIDILYGSDSLRHDIDRHHSPAGRTADPWQRGELAQWCAVDVAAWWERVDEILLYS
jgi:hypothetical protein